MNDKTLRKKAVEKTFRATSRTTTTTKKNPTWNNFNQANERLVYERKNFETLKKDIEGDIKMEVSSMLKD